MSLCLTGLGHKRLCFPDISPTSPPVFYSRPTFSSEPLCVTVTIATPNPCKNPALRLPSSGQCQKMGIQLPNQTLTPTAPCFSLWHLLLPSGGLHFIETLQQNRDHSGSPNGIHITLTLTMLCLLQGIPFFAFTSVCTSMYVCVCKAHKALQQLAFPSTGLFFILI